MHVTVATVTYTVDDELDVAYGKGSGEGWKGACKAAIENAFTRVPAGATLVSASVVPHFPDVPG